MGLLDVLNGMAHGPRGTPDAEAPTNGMSKTTMALLALLGYKAYKSLTSQASQAHTPQYRHEDRDYQRDDRDERYSDHERYGRDQQYDRDGPDDRPAPQGGGLGNILRDIFGRGSVPGPVLRRGIDNTVRDLEHRGYEDIARSWVGRGENLPITPRQLEAALGERAIRDMMQQTGMERTELLETLSRYLPRVIDHLTPEGRLPSDEEATRMG